MAAKKAAKPKNRTVKKEPAKKTHKPMVTDEQLADAIMSTSGNYASMQMFLANKYGTTLSCSRISERISMSEELQSALSETKLKKLKIVEGALDKKIREGCLPAIIFYLKTQGKEHGWSERHEVTGANGERISAAQVEILQLPDNGRD